MATTVSPPPTLRKTTNFSAIDFTHFKKDVTSGSGTSGTEANVDERESSNSKVYGTVEFQPLREKEERMVLGYSNNENTASKCFQISFATSLFQNVKNQLQWLQNRH